MPLWPFAILAILMLVGWRQSRDRVVRPSTLVKVALGMLALSLYGVLTAFGANLVPLLAWAAGFAACVKLGGQLLAPRGLSHEGAAVRVPGSWWPMGLMMGIFIAKFALGFATGVDAHVVHETWFIAAMSLLFGLLSGAFSARAKAVQRFAETQPAV
ncbi:DUF6622 family protein [Roseateles cellulosilyticus]|uniref:Transmembrane protein n=1 Tax=Pelomonas cellulosilytica TaxID=2906762 RepID=A0ABS8XWP9_9BURK|nr:DUF6622 family protein [Pelomonas sp. P8]MCE4556222.1 hypothetical protein [Pelomonas sp. P8]